jgi:pectinesterase
MMYKTIFVGNTHDYKTISQALEHIKKTIEKSEISWNDSKGYKILLSPGLYQEKLSIDLDHVVIKGMGQKPEDTRIVWQDGAEDLDNQGQKLGTFRTPTLYIDAKTLLMENLSVENLAGPGKEFGQAIALALNVERALVKNCVLTGDQDTLFLAPLPEKALQKKGFLGSEAWNKRNENANIFSQCKIEGGVDFIFGSGAAYFEKCLIRAGRGYITAASTPADAAYGLIFHDCRVENRDDIEDPHYYLGRPWRNHAKTAFLNCYLDKGLFPQGWHDWNKEEARKTALYEEYKNDGPGSPVSRRPSWAHVLSQMPQAYTLKSFIEYFDFPPEQREALWP